MSVYNELMAETTSRLENPDYFTPVDQVPSHIARSVLNRLNLFQGVRPGNELPVADVPSALMDSKISGIVPGEIMFGIYDDVFEMKALPWIAQPAIEGSQSAIDEDEVRNELFRHIPMNMRTIMKHTDIIRAHALNMQGRRPVVIVDAISPISTKEMRTRRNALDRTAHELAMAKFLLIESRENITLLNKR
jgi:hypothetical protein